MMLAHFQDYTDVVGDHPSNLAATTLEPDDLAFACRVRAEERLHLRGDRGIDRLFAFEQAFPARRVEGDRFVEHRRDPLPVGTQAGVSSSFASQARATAQWRFTVAGEMPIASAVSSIERPPK